MPWAYPSICSDQSKHSATSASRTASLAALARVRMKLRAEHPATVNRLAPFEVGTTAAMLKFVTNKQLRVDAGACIGSAYSIDPGLDGESAVLGRDGQADFHEVLAVIS